METRISFITFIVIATAAFTDAYNCKSKRFTAKTGEFSSPNHPRSYPDNAKCEYFIKAKSGHYVEITFTTFKLEYKGDVEKTDYVQVLDGRAKNRQQEIYYEGSLPTPFKFISKSGRVFVNFVSNADFGFLGFKATYRMIPRNKCDSSKLEIEHGTVKCNSDDAGLVESCQVTCDETYTLHGLAKVFCQDGEFVAPPTCEPNPLYHCDMKKLGDLNTECIKDPDTGRVEECKVICEHPYMLLGNETMTCEGNKWSQVPECSPDPDILDICDANPDNSSCLFTREETERFHEAFFDMMANVSPLVTGKSVDGAMYGCPRKLCLLRRSNKSYYFDCLPHSKKMQRKYKWQEEKRKFTMKHCFRCQSVQCLHSVFIFS